MGKRFRDILYDFLFDKNSFIGWHGEAATAKELNRLNIWGQKGKVLRNLYIPKNNGATTEIDLVFLTKKGIFVLESKNYSGWIFGDEASMYWTAMLPNREKNRFYNPIKQNRTHIKWLNQYLGGAIPMFSMIVFSERCELKKISVTSSDVYVVKRHDLLSTIADIGRTAPDLLSEEELNALYLRLNILTDVDRAVEQAHINTLQNKYTQTDRSKKAFGETAMICPRCGGKLILRTARKGPNAGNQFYGCGNYPKCHYTQSILK